MNKHDDDQPSREDTAENLITALRYLALEARKSGFTGTSRLIDTAAQSLTVHDKVGSHCN